MIMGAIGLMAAFAAIGDSFLIVFVGIFLALVFEYPTRFVMAKTKMSRGLAATVTVIGAAVAVFVLALLLLVPLVGSVRDYLHDLPATVATAAGLERALVARRLRVGRERAGRRAAGRKDGAGCDLSRPRRRRQLLLGLPGLVHGSLRLLVPAQSDIGNLKRSLASVLMPGDDERWLGVWERVTASISRWAIGVVIIAVIAGTTQGVTAWLLGSSYAVALGVIAGLLDMIPNIGATIAGFILVPTLWAEQGLTAALIMLAVVLVYQQVENSILTPKIQGKAVSLSAVLHHRRGVAVRRSARCARSADRRSAGGDDPDLRAGADEGAAREGGCGQGRPHAGRRRGSQLLAVARHDAGRTKHHPIWTMPRRRILVSFHEMSNSPSWWCGLGR